MSPRGIRYWGLILAVFIAGCGDPPLSEVDRKLRDTILGAWIGDAVVGSAEPVSSVAVYRIDKTWTAIEKVKRSTGALEEFQLDGEWFVTDGLFKRRLDRVNGTAAPGGASYLTCRVEIVNDVNFLCKNDVTGGAYVYRRGSVGYEISKR